TGHAPFLGTLGIGTVRIHPVGGGAVVRAAVHGGFVEVRDNKVSVLSDVAELSEHLDAERARRALAAAEEGLRGTPDDPELTAAYRRAQIRIETALAA
ncbi:MAG TPA: F0F1 ATP synthase subunit epsilon, partial [Acidimicrobiales bacterium]|nr:F0F1 ATP synthase subunit epsilon [Acidimicrobiales bacterium]